MVFSLDISAVAAWRQRVIDAIDAADELCATATNEVATKLVEELKTQAPYDGSANNGVIPGEEHHLNESFGMNQADPGSIAQAEVWTDEPIKYQYVTQGTDGPILPVEKIALWWPGAQHPVGSVSGQQANLFQTKAQDEIESTLPEIIQPCIDEWLGGI